MDIMAMTGEYKCDLDLGRPGEESSDVLRFRMKGFLTKHELFLQQQWLDVKVRKSSKLIGIMVYLRSEAAEVLASNMGYPCQLSHEKLDQLGICAHLRELEVEHKHWPRERQVRPVRGRPHAHPQRPAQSAHQDRHAPAVWLGRPLRPAAPARYARAAAPRLGQVGEEGLRQAAHP